MKMKKGGHCLVNKYKIMLVDDEPDILELLEKVRNIEGLHNIFPLHF